MLDLLVHNPSTMKDYEDFDDFCLQLDATSMVMAISDATCTAAGAVCGNGERSMDRPRASNPNQQIHLCQIGLTCTNDEAWRCRAGFIEGGEGCDDGVANVALPGAGGTQTSRGR
jgi:hypothetical protein